MSNNNEMPQWAKDLQKQQEEMLERIEEIKSEKKPEEKKTSPAEKKPDANALKKDISSWAKSAEASNPANINTGDDKA